jgi:hypothetical protein
MQADPMSSQYIPTVLRVESRKDPGKPRGELLDDPAHAFLADVGVIMNENYSLTTLSGDSP